MAAQRRLVLDLDIAEEVAGLGVEVDRVGHHAVLDQRALEIGPDRAMAPLVFGLLSRVYRHAKRLANHVRIIAGRSRIVSSKVDSPLEEGRVMANDDGVTRREFVSTATGAAVGALVAGETVGSAAQAKRRYAIVGTGVRGDRHVGPADPARLSRPRRVRRPVRHQPAARRGREEADGRVVPDLHQLRRDARRRRSPTS